MMNTVYHQVFVALALVLAYFRNTSSHTTVEWQRQTKTIKFPFFVHDVLLRGYDSHKVSAILGTYVSGAAHVRLVIGL